MDEFGRVDVLVNNAGIGTAVPATRETPEQFRQVIDVNLNGCYWMAQACGRVMQPGSQHHQHQLASSASPPAGLPQAAYSATKAGLIGLTRDLAQQWTGRKGIRVNALAPGLLRVGDDRPVPRRLPRPGDGRGSRPAARATRAELAATAGVPGLRRRPATSPARPSPSTAG